MNPNATPAEIVIGDQTAVTADDLGVPLSSYDVRRLAPHIVAVCEARHRHDSVQRPLLLALGGTPRQRGRPMNNPELPAHLRKYVVIRPPRKADTYAWVEQPGLDVIAGEVVPEGVEGCGGG